MITSSTNLGNLAKFVNSRILTIVYIVLFIALAAAGIIGAVSSQSSITQHDKIINGYSREYQSVISIMRESDEVQAAVLRHLLNNDPTDRQEERKAVYYKNIPRHPEWQKLRSLAVSEEETEVIENLVQVAEINKKQTDSLITLSLSSGESDEAALYYYYDIQKPGYEQYQNALVEFSREIDTKIKTAAEKTERAVINASNFVNSLLILTFAIILVLGLMMIDYIERLKRQKIQTTTHEMKFRNFVDNSRELVQKVKFDGHFVFTNKSWKQLFGYKEGEIFRMNFFDIVDEESKDSLQEDLDWLAAGHSISKWNLVLRSRSGEKIYVEGSAEPFSLNGVVCGFQAFLHDITDKVMLLRQLKAN